MSPRPRPWARLLTAPCSSPPAPRPPARQPPRPPDRRPPRPPDRPPARRPARWPPSRPPTTSRSPWPPARPSSASRCRWPCCPTARCCTPPATARSGSPTPPATPRWPASIPVYTHDEEGLQGVAVDPNFATNRYVYLYYSPPLSTPGRRRPGHRHRRRLRRRGRATSTCPGSPSTPTTRSTWPARWSSCRSPNDRGQCCHVGGDIDFDAAGNLYLTTGDDTNPFESSGYTPDRRADQPQPAVRRAALLGQHQRPARQGAADQAAGRRHATPSRRATCSRRARRTPGPRSTRWASATRSG